MNPLQLRKIICSMPGIVSCWVPGSNRQAVDIVRGNHGTVHGANRNIEVYPNQIRNDLGWSFDGVDDYVNCGQIAALNNLSTSGKSFFSFCWIYTRASATEQRIFQQQDGSGLGRSWMYLDDSLRFTSYFSYPGLSSPNSLSTNKYYFLAMTFDGSTQRLFENGIEVASTSDSIPDADGDFLIGISKDLSTDPFDGYITLIGVGDQNISQTEIFNLYNTTKDLFYPRG